MPKELNLARFVSFSSLLSIFVGLMGLTGCFFRIQTLRTFVPGMVAIAANSSLCLILLGISLWCMRERDGLAAGLWSQWLAKLAAAAAGAVGLLSLVEYLGKLDFGIDQLFFTEPAPQMLGQVRPGLMSPVSALELVLLGSALLLLDWTTRRKTWPSQVLCFIGGIIAIFTFLDLLVDPRHFRAHIAVPTVIMITLFPMAVICARPRRAMGGLLLASGSKKALVRELLLPTPASRGSRGGPLQYAMAVVLVAAATLVRYWLVGYVPAGVVFVTYFPAVMVAALVGGLGPGILATLLSAACVNYFFFSPVGVFTIANRSDLLALLMFLAICFAISWLASALEQIREEAAAALRQSENELRQAQHVARIGAWKWDAASDTSSWSAEMYEIFGWDSKLPAPTYKEHLQYTCPEGAALEDAAVQNALTTGQPYEFDLEIVLKDGTRKWVVNRGTPDRDSDGRITGLHGTVQDITDRKRAEESLQRSEAKLQLHFDRMPIGCVMWDTDFRVQSWNPAATTIFGFTSEEAIGRHPYDFLVPKEGQAATDDIFARLSAGDTTAHSTNENLTKDGRTILCRWTNTPLRDDHGQFLGILSMVEDVTARTMAEAQVQYMNDVIEHSQQPFVSTDPDGAIRVFNKAYEKLTGYSRDELLKLTHQELTPSRWHAMEARLVAEAMATGLPTPRYEKEYRRKDGTLVPVELVVEMHRNRQGKLWQMSAFIVDLTERKQAEAILAAERQKFNTILDSVPPYVCLLTPDYHVGFANREFRTRFGEHKGRKCYEFLFNRTEPCEVCETYKVLTDGQPRNWQWTGPDGCHYDIFDFPFTDTDGSKLILEMGIDVTERKRAQDAVKAERQRFEDVLDGLPVMVCLLTPAYDVAFANQAFRNQFGESQGRKCYDYCYGKSAPCEFCESFQVLKTGAPHDWEVINKGRNIHAFDLPFTDVDGSPLILEMDVDVTEQERAKRALQESESNFRTLANFVPQMVWMCKPDGLNIYFNQRWFDYTGLSPEESYGRGWNTPFHVDDQQAAWDAWNCAVATGDTYRVESRLRAADGTYRWFLMRGLPLRDDAGNIVRWFGTCTDIDDMKRAEAQLARLNQELEERVRQRTAELETVLATVPIGLAIAEDAECRHIRGNPAFERLVGAPAGAEVSRSAPECVPYHVFQDGHEQLPEELPMQRASRGQSISGETFEIVRPDESRVMLHASAAPLYDNEGKPHGSVGAFVDITSLKRAEAALQESEHRVRRKLDSILLPEADLGNLELADILDAPAIRKLLEEFYAIVHVTTGVIDRHGKVLAVPAWQAACMKFHRAHPESCSNCVESDVRLAAGVRPGEYKLYKCKNNLWDAATPIIIGDQHLGNLYLGQFFFTDEAIDYEVFREQAKRYGYHEQDYLKAIEAVPRISRELFDASMTFLTTLAKNISQFSYSTIKLARSSTQISRANEELAAANRRLGAAQRAAMAGIWTWDIPASKMTWSPELFELFGLPDTEQASFETWKRTLHPQDRERATTTVDDALTGRKALENEYRITLPGGQERWIRAVGSTVYDKHGAPQSMSGICLDITQRKRAEAALRQSEEKFRNLFENIEEMVTVYEVERDDRGIIVERRLREANRAALRALGISSVEEIRGRTSKEIFGKAWSDSHLPAIQKTMDTGQVQVLEVYRPESDRHYLSSVVRLDHDTYLGNAWDITERKQAEEALRDSETRFRALAHNVPDLVWTCTPEGKCDYVNSRYAEYTGIPAEKLLGFEWLKQVHPEDRERALAEWKKTLETDVLYESDFRIRSRDGTYRYFKCRGSAVRDANGRIVKWFGTSTDVEDLRRLQENLAAANKELESFNYAVAHDLRAPLRHIHGFAELLTQEAASVLNETAQRHLAVIRASIERMGQLLQELLNLSKLGRQELRKEPSDMSLLVQQILAELKPDIVDREIEWRIGDLPSLECDPTLMKQVLSNLISNAVKFTRKRSPAVIEIGQTARNGVPVIFIRDNGEGFDMQYVDKLFGLFQRLHRMEEFEGTGVGLAIVQRIINRHGGSVWAEGELNRGATFYFSLQPCEVEQQKVA